MGRYIAKLGDDAYCEWSTVVDAPISWILSRAQAVVDWTEERVARADRNGTSVIDGYPAGETPEEIVAYNRAGPLESTLTVDQVIDRYTSPESYADFNARAKILERTIGDDHDQWTQKYVVDA